MIKMDTVVISGRKYSETELFKEKEEYVRLEAVDMCFALTVLIQDRSSVVRAAVARKKVGHDILVNDTCWRVRATVAKYTDEPELVKLLAKDENEFVRFIVVKKGHCLEFLRYDEDEEIASTARYLLQNLEPA